MADDRCEEIRLRPEIYDPTTGKYGRKQKYLDGFTQGNAFTAVNSSTILASTTLPSTKNGFLTCLSVGADINAVVSVVSNSSTLFSVSCGDNETQTINVSDDEPLSRIDAGATVVLVAQTMGNAEAGTLTAFAAYKLETVAANLETE